MIWFDLHEDEQSPKNKVAEHPHSKFLVCNEDIDHIIGYVDSKDLAEPRVLANTKAGTEQRRTNSQHADCAGYVNPFRGVGKF